MLDIPAASLLHPHLNTRQTSLNSLFAVAQVHAPNALGPVYAGKSFWNPIVQLKSVQYFSSTWKLHIHHAPVLRKPRALESVLFNKTFYVQSVSHQWGLRFAHESVVVYVWIQVESNKGALFFFFFFLNVGIVWLLRGYSVWSVESPQVQILEFELVWSCRRGGQGDDGCSAGGQGSQTVQPFLRVCVPACMCTCLHKPCEPSHTHTLQSSPCEADGLSFSLVSSRGQHVPLSQVGVQSVENAELLFRLKHQQLL